MADDFDIICSKIDEGKEFLNAVSQEIWKNPELCYNEVHAHEFLSDAFTKYGFQVEKHYLLNTAFRAEYAPKGGNRIFFHSIHCSIYFAVKEAAI